MAEFANRYNDTPVDPDDAVAFIDGVAFESKADLYDAEAQALSDLRSQLYEAIADGSLDASDITGRFTLEKMHELANRSIWTWAGQIRRKGLNVGAPPEHIREQLYGTLDTLTWQVENMTAHSLTPEQIAMRAHHQLVKIHPFTDGNGRITRLFADVLLLALTGDRVFDWTEAEEYFEALREADVTTEVDELLRVVGIEVIPEE